MLADSLPLVAFAFSAGVGTFFAPCAYPLLPGYVSFYLGETATGTDTASAGGVEADGGQTSTERTGVGRATTGTTATDDSVFAGDGPGTGRVARGVARRLDPIVPGGHAPAVIRATVVGVLVSVGFFLAYGVLGGITAAVGSQLLSNISVLELVVGVVLIVIGTTTALGYDLPTPTVRLPERRRSATAFVGFGVLYAAAAAGCTGTIFVGIGVQAIAAGPVVAGATFAAYAGGMSLLMILVTAAAALGRDTLLTRLSGRTRLIERAMGVLLVVAGLAQLYYFTVVFDGFRLLGLR